MNTPTKLGAYALGLAVVFGGAAGVGKIAGPEPATAKTGGGHTSHGGTETGPQTAGGHMDQGGKTTGPQTGGIAVPGGLQISQGGYTLVPQTTTLKPGHVTDFRFAVNGPDGLSVTNYVPQHGKKLHFIVARRDLSGFQHLHPHYVEAGIWSVALTLPQAGSYRAFTDFKPARAKQQLTLGMDLSAPGDYRPRPLPKATQVAQVGGYKVRLAGSLVPGRTSKLTLSVSKDGKPVTDLQPYLEAYGHLVALRDGDLAYLHVHPDGAPGDGKTRPGPDITFYAEVPTSGAYRLYLDFQHAGTVRTAEFTAIAGEAADPTDPTSGPAGEPTGPHTH